MFYVIDIDHISPSEARTWELRAGEPRLEFIPTIGHKKVETLTIMISGPHLQLPTLLRHPAASSTTKEQQLDRRSQACWSVDLRQKQQQQC